MSTWICNTQDNGKKNIEGCWPNSVLRTFFDIRYNNDRQLNNILWKDNKCLRSINILLSCRLDNSLFSTGLLAKPGCLPQYHRLQAMAEGAWRPYKELGYPNIPLLHSKQYGLGVLFFGLFFSGLIKMPHTSMSTMVLLKEIEALCTAFFLWSTFEFRRQDYLATHSNF